MLQGSSALLKMLAEINPRQPYGTELFDALARVTISVSVEAVCFRRGGSKDVSVFLKRRSCNDTAYPGEWHVPGSIFRPGEEPEDVLDRLAKREFGCPVEFVQFVANVNHTQEARGHCLSTVYLCRANSIQFQGMDAGWFSVNELPEKTVECHRHRIIPAALGAYVARHPYAMS